MYEIKQTTLYDTMYFWNDRNMITNNIFELSDIMVIINN